MASAQQAATPAAPAAAPLVFDHVTVVDVEQGKLVPNQRVVITGNRIGAMGGVNAIKVPKGARVVPADRQYLIPGLWDLHTHTFDQDEIFYPLFIANGVTGIRDAWSSLSLERQVQRRDEILAGRRVGPPRQLLTGLNPGQITYTCDSIRAYKARGANFLKVYPLDFSKAQAARCAGIQFGGHIPESMTSIQASDSGASILDHTNTSGGLNHTCWGGAASLEDCQRVAERLRQNNTWLVPTLIVLKAETAGNWWGGGTRSRPIYDRLVAQAGAFWAGTMPVGNWLRDHDTTSQGEILYFSTLDSVGYMQLLHRVGLPILAGTDVGAVDVRVMPPGFVLQAELATYVAEGLSPLEALRSATLNPAKMLRGTDSLGTVATGKLADLVLLDADPLADITNTTTIRAVVANGRYFDRAALDSLLAQAQAKGPGRP